MQSDVLLLAGVFESFLNKSIEIHKIDPRLFHSAQGLAGQACFKKTGVELELLANVHMLLMAEKEIRGRMCHTIHLFANVHNNCMKYYDNKKELLYLM